VEWINLYAEYEAEPDVDIYRFGVNIPLALFNQKKEERSVALLEQKSQRLQVENEQNSVSLKQKQLAREYEGLQRLIRAYKSTLEKNTQLLELFHEGFKIASIDIVQIEQIKSSLISAKRRLIEAEIALERNIVLQNYLKGK